MVLVYQVYMSNSRTEITAGKQVQKQHLVIVREIPLLVQALVL